MSYTVTFTSSQLTGWDNATRRRGESGGFGVMLTQGKRSRREEDDLLPVTSRNFLGKSNID